MQYSSAVLLAAAGLVSNVAAHGIITSPTPRLPGPAMESACGTQVYDNQSSDDHGNIQGELQVAATQSDYNAAECDIWLCKGYKFADNTNIESYTAGQVVDIVFDIAAPHTGTANVSIVNTATNTVIEQLAYWPTFASTSTTIPANETNFSITIPSDLPSECATAGGCVIQHWWNAESIDQTYESCIDFAVSGASGSDSSASSSVAVVATSSAAAVVASSSAVSSAAAVVVTSSSASSSSAVATTSSSAVPTTFSTLTKASSTSVAAAATSSAAPEEDDDTCDA